MKREEESRKKKMWVMLPGQGAGLCREQKASFKRCLMCFEDGAEILRFESYAEYSTLIPG